MTLLVTGGAGFIGSYFIEMLLAAGGSERIVCLDDFNSSYDPALKRANAARFAADPRITVVEKSFCDAVVMRALLAEHRVRQIVHLGACAGVRASFEQPRLYHDTNVGGSRALLEAASSAPVERFVLVSSSTVYGRGAAVPFQEDAPLGEPLSPYGVSKREAEAVGQTFFREHGLPVVSLRPFSVYGPRMRPDLAMRVFAEAIVAGRRLPLFGDGTIRRDFTHVSDICRGLLAALTAEGVEGQPINLGHHEPVAIGTLVELLEAELGIKADVDYRPAFAGDMPVTCADLTKAERLLSYRPRVALDEGVRDFVAWFRKWKEADG